MTSLSIVYNTLIISQLGVPPKRIKNAFFHLSKYMQFSDKKTRASRQSSHEALIRHL